MDQDLGRYTATSYVSNLDLRFFAGGLEIYVASPALVIDGLTDNEYDETESETHVTDLVFGARYQLASVLALFVDLDLFSFDEDYGMHYWEAGIQFAKPFTPSFVLGSQVGAKWLFEKDGLNPGMDLNAGLELDKTFFKKLTIFGVYYMQIPVSSGDYDRDFAWQTTFGLSFAFTRRFGVDAYWKSYDSVFSTGDSSLGARVKFGRFN